MFFIKNALLRALRGEKTLYPNLRVLRELRGAKFFSKLRASALKIVADQPKADPW